MREWGDVTIAIPTVTGRAGVLRELREQLAAECQGATIVAHVHVPGTPARVDFPAVLESARRDGRPWILQMEDDAYLAPAFGSLSLAALREAEHADLCAGTLFSRSKADAEAYRTGAVGWKKITPSVFSMSQAFFVRADLVEGFQEWAPSWYAAHPEHNRAADLLFGAWLSLRRAQVGRHVPSLVQHRRLASTLPNHRGARRSETFTLAFGDAP